MNEPTIIIAGDTISWTEELPNYPAATWTLTYLLKFAATTPTPIIAIGADALHTTTIPSGVTATLNPGKYQLSGRMTSIDSAYTIYQGYVVVLPDPSKPYDNRSHFEKGLAAIEAVLDGRLSDPITDYEIDGYKVSNIPHKELVELYSFYKAAVRRQQGGSPCKGIPVSKIFRS